MRISDWSSDVCSSDLHANRYGIIARDARILHAREIRRLTSERRYATLAAFVIERQASITDLTIDMFCKMIGSNRRKAEISRTERRLKEAEVLDGVALEHLKLGEALRSEEHTSELQSL